MSVNTQFDPENISSCDTFIELPTQETVEDIERDRSLSGLSVALPNPGAVWGWLVPGHPSPPQLSVRPLSLTSGEVFTVGRETDCNLTLEEWMFPEESAFQYVSRLHFQIFRRDQKTLIVDKSGNGTVVQGVKLVKDEPRVLKHGESIDIQGVELFCYLDQHAMLYIYSFPIGIITNYLVGNVVGRGTFGIVRKGFTRNTFQPVALKFLPKCQSDRSVSNEVGILCQLHHPCITELKDVVNDKDGFFIVMEFAEGGELERQVILDRTFDRLSERTAKIQFYQIVHAVAYIHSKNICHRDLKLSNILMSSEGPLAKLKISDFGISKIWSSIVELRTHVGTPVVMAPEVGHNPDQKAYTSKADCWSLGVVLYQLLSGQLPHHDYGKMTGERWEAVTDLAKDLVISLLKEDPDDRPSAGQALQHRWFQGDEQVCRLARNIMFDTEDSVLMESGSESEIMPQGQQINNNPPSDFIPEVNLPSNENIPKIPMVLLPSSENIEDMENMPSSDSIPKVNLPSSDNIPRVNLPSNDNIPEVNIPKVNLPSSDNIPKVNIPSNDNAVEKPEVPTSQVQQTISNWRDKKDQSLNESDDDKKMDFHDFKARLRPRNQINYRQVNNSPRRVMNKTPRKFGENQEIQKQSVKRKDNEESKQGKLSFNLPSKRRRRASEQQPRVSTVEETEAGIGRRVKGKRSRRKSGY